MINNVNYSPSFGSTRVPYDNTLIHNYSNELIKYFKIKEFPKNLKPQEIANKINFDEVAFVMGDKEAMFIGKDGGLGGADTFIGRILKQVNPNVKYVDDIKPINIQGEAIDLLL